MILQALVKRYEDAVSEKQKPGWEPRPVDFYLNINEDGEVLEVISRGDGKGEREQRLLPETATRSSGIKPYFLCDNAGYILGVDSKDKKGQQKNDGAKKYAAAKELHLKVLADVNAPVAAAIKNYFSKAPNPPGDIPETRNDLLFMVDGRRAYEDESIRKAWDSYNTALSRSTKRVLDLVTGREDALQSLQGEVKAARRINGEEASCKH
jgi:CRISPR-associated protein (Cas_Csd1).